MKYWKLLKENLNDAYGYDAIGEDYDHLFLFRGTKKPEQYLSSTRLPPNKNKKLFNFKDKIWKKFHPTSQHGRSAESVGPENEITEKEVKEIINNETVFRNTRSK